tara:strand:+ start:5761 stop:6960 length:1200 start_codon:yes stop_codon:yes gene_type:complete
MEEPAIEYNLQTPCYDIHNLITEDTEDVHVIDKYDGNLILVKYNKQKLNDDNWETLGKFRSLIYDKNAKRVISYFPPKSCIGFDFGDDQERYLEEFYEGTMISLFWYDIIEDWEITTRSNIGAKCSYKPGGETFRTLFLNTLNKQNIELEDFDKNFCYTFVLQHKLNRIVCPIKDNKVILVDVIKCGNNGKIYRWKRDVFYKMIHNIVKNENIIVPERWKLNMMWASKNLDNAPYFFMGYVFYEEDGTRCKMRNQNYEYVRHLKGNNPKIQYRYYHLRNNNLVKEYLQFYPEDRKTFSELRNNLHKYTKNLYQSYITCYIKKEKPLKEYDYKYKTHMYYLHELYKNELKNKGFYINMNEVIKYINGLEPPRLMHVINADVYRNEKDIVKVEIQDVLQSV